MSLFLVTTALACLAGLDPTSPAIRVEPANPTAAQDNSSAEGVFQY